MPLWSLFPLPSADKAPRVSHPLSLVLRMHSRGLHAAESPRNLLNIHSQGSPYPCSTQSGVLQLGQQYTPWALSMFWHLKQARGPLTWLTPSRGADCPTIPRQRQRRCQACLSTASCPWSDHRVIIFLAMCWMGMCLTYRTVALQTAWTPWGCFYFILFQPFQVKFPTWPVTPRTLVNVRIVLQTGSDCGINAIQKWALINSGVATERRNQARDADTQRLCTREEKTHINSKQSQFK